MFSFFFTYPVLFCLFALLFLISIVLLLAWGMETRRWRTRDRERKASPGARIVAFLVLILPCLTIIGSLTLYISAQHMPCRSDYSSNTDASLASSVLVGSNAYGTQDSELAMTRARDGAIQWEHVMNPSNPLLTSGRLTEANGILYFFSNDYSLNAVRISDGSTLWRTYLKAVPYDSEQSPLPDQAPMIANDMVFVHVPGAQGDPQSKDEIDALSAQNGEVKWKISLPGSTGGSDLSYTANGGFFYLADSESITAYLIKNQEKIWSISEPELFNKAQASYGPSLSLYAAPNSIYFISRWPASSSNSVDFDMSISSAQINTGDLQWTRNLRATIDWMNSPIQFSHFGTHLYLHAGSTLFALDATNGATRWQREIGPSLGASTIEKGNITYAPGFGSNGRPALYALHAQNGSLVWQCNNFGYGAGFVTLALYQDVLLVNSDTVYPHYHDLLPNFSEPSNALFALSAEDGSVYWRDTSISGNLVFSP